MNVEHLATFAAVGFTLLIAHHVADHWVQSSWEATNKGRRDSTGRAACLSHVVSYTITSLFFILVVVYALGAPLSVWGVVAGQALSSISHYVADRRFPLQWLAERRGHGDFYQLGAPRDVKAYEVVRLNGEHGSVLRQRDGNEPADPIPWDNLSLGTGAYVLDQSYHWFFIFCAAILMVMIP